MLPPESVAPLVIVVLGLPALLSAAELPGPTDTPPPAASGGPETSALFAHANERTTAAAKAPVRPTKRGETKRVGKTDKGRRVTARSSFPMGMEEQARSAADGLSTHSNGSTGNPGVCRARAFPQRVSSPAFFRRRCRRSDDSPRRVRAPAVRRQRRAPAIAETGFSLPSLLEMWTVGSARRAHSEFTMGPADRAPWARVGRGVRDGALLVDDVQGFRAWTSRREGIFTLRTTLMSRKPVSDSHST